MLTILAQIEAAVNSRPLGLCPDDHTEYLSPSHFLIGRHTSLSNGSTTGNIYNICTKLSGNNGAKNM